MVEVVGTIDVAQIVLYVFWVFFAGLLFYLRQEDRREGYPLVSEVDGKRDEFIGGIWVPEPKKFILPHGEGVTQAPRGEHDVDGEIRAVPSEKWAGAPLVPVGDPMLAAIGPGAYAQRADRPDLSDEGMPRIAPLRFLPGFYLETRDPDPRGMKVLGCDKRIAGTVTDVWVDRAEMLIRYLEVQVESGKPGAPIVLLPMTFARIDGGRGRVHVKSILAHQFENVPQTKGEDRITLLEEDMVSAYYRAGHMYATPNRAEPLL